MQVNEDGNNGIKIIYTEYARQDSQYGVQPRNIPYEVHQNISVNIYITFTNILIKL